MLHQLSLASDTLSSSRGDLFGTVRGLQIFMSLAGPQRCVRASFSNQLNGISRLLDNNRSALAVALARLDDAVAQVGTSSSTTGPDCSPASASCTSSRTRSPASSTNSPTAARSADRAVNFYNIVDPRYHAATGTLAAANFDNLAQLICTQIVRPAAWCRTA